MYSCNPRAREMEAGGSGSQAHSNFEISVGYIKPYLKKQNSPAWCYILLNPALRRQGKLISVSLKPNWIYMASFRLVRVIT